MWADEGDGNGGPGLGRGQPPPAQYQQPPPQWLQQQQSQPSQPPHWLQQQPPSPQPQQWQQYQYHHQQQPGHQQWRPRRSGRPRSGRGFRGDGGRGRPPLRSPRNLYDSGLGREYGSEERGMAEDQCALGAGRGDQHGPPAQRGGPRFRVGSQELHVLDGAPFAGGAGGVSARGRGSPGAAAAGPNPRRFGDFRRPRGQRLSAPTSERHPALFEPPAGALCGHGQPQEAAAAGPAPPGELLSLSGVPVRAGRGRGGRGDARYAGRQARRFRGRGGVFPPPQDYEGGRLSGADAELPAQVPGGAVDYRAAAIGATAATFGRERPHPGGAAPLLPSPYGRPCADAGRGQGSHLRVRGELLSHGQLHTPGFRPPGRPGRGGVHPGPGGRPARLADPEVDGVHLVAQTEESSPRRLELVSGLFEHLTVECVNDIVDACNHPDVPGTGGGGGSGAAGGGAAAEGGAATNAPVPMSTGNVSPSVVSSSKLSCDSPVFVPASATAAGCATPRAPAT
uniref:UL91.1 n=1 Tax=Panine betaherpesvirus 2 TaxID=188763 RepID=A0A8F7PNX6_9BETA|nr:UL91.1 [Panine betaherpesvirus 2]